jgi:hypothetical protein
MLRDALKSANGNVRCSGENAHEHPVHAETGF